MELFSKYIDQIKAESDLKQRTNAFVKAEIEREHAHKSGTFTRFAFLKEAFAKRRISTAVYMMAAFAVFTFSGVAYYNQPANYVSLDINPSVELGVNAFNIVIDSEGINTDGEALIKVNSVLHMTLEEAIGALVREAATQKFIAADGSTVIAVTAISGKDATAVSLKEKCEDAVQQAIDSENIEAIIYADYTNLELRARARDLGISTGKYKMIEILQGLDESITFKQYSSVTVTNIISKANELLLSAEKTNVIFTEKYKKTLDMIKITAAKIEGTVVNNQTTRIMDQNSGLPLMEQNMEQDKFQVQTQGTDEGQAEIISEPGTSVILEVVTEPGVINDSGGNDAGAGGSGGGDFVDKNNLDSGNPQDNMSSDGKRQEGGKI
ncbi:MAG: hypothetical protein JJE17_07450 [Peptostreptococcaceae bacterium]|nr:hypothetical protein [Peptostreptococcaceae bacterium]